MPSKLLQQSVRRWRFLIRQSKAYLALSADLRAIGNQGQDSKKKTALVLGCYESGNGLELTRLGESKDNVLGGSVLALLAKSKFEGRIGKTRTFYSLHDKYDCITVTGLGKANEEFDENEDLDPLKENVRQAIGAAVKSLKADDVTSIEVDPCSQPSAAAEAATLAAFTFDKYKSKKKNHIELCLSSDAESSAIKDWNDGCVVAEGQNFARALMETPSNYKYPELFVELIRERFSSRKEIEFVVRDTKWARAKGMGCFLSVGQGSEHESKFLELAYRGSDRDPFVLVGKGVTFDSGGISIKPSAGMAAMKGDMGGAACVLAALESAVRLSLPVHLVVLIPLVENMPSGSATNPGDVFTAMNGKSVEVDNTDAEGRLILADALCYAEEFKPQTVINLATLTGAMDVALGGGATGCFTTCSNLWSTLHESGQSAGDRLWRMPLYKHYTKQMECSGTADLRNTQKKARSAGSATAAAFLKEFVTTRRWAHLDIAGVMDNAADASYLTEGMTGRPTRTLIETVRRLSVKS